MPTKTTTKATAKKADDAKPKAAAKSAAAPKTAKTEAAPETKGRGAKEAPDGLQSSAAFVAWPDAAKGLRSTVALVALPLQGERAG